MKNAASKRNADRYAEMQKHLPLKGAADLRVVANGIFTIVRDTDGMDDKELIQTLALLSGIACGAMIAAAEIMERGEE